MKSRKKAIEKIDTATIKDTQSLILEVLKEFQRICDEQNLRFYLIAGSLLGAVRHQGFIPWDDDIDVGMPRKDYDIFIKNAYKWLKSPFELDCAETNDKYLYFFAKIVNSNTTIVQRFCISGVFMDIFPLDGAPTSKLRKRLHHIRVKAAKELFLTCRRDPFRHGKTLGSYIDLLVRKIVSPKQAYKIYRSVLTSHDFEKTQNFTDHGKKITNMIDKSVLGDVKYNIQFADFETYGMQNNDAYLRCYFGNYMQLPPVESRKPHHCTYRNLDLPFREYIKSNE